MRQSVRILGLRVPFTGGDRLEQRYATRLGDMPLHVRRWSGHWYVSIGNPIIFATDSHRLYWCARNLRTFLSEVARATSEIRMSEAS